MDQDEAMGGPEAKMQKFTCILGWSFVEGFCTRTPRASQAGHSRTPPWW